MGDRKVAEVWDSPAARSRLLPQPVSERLRHRGRVSARARPRLGRRRRGGALRGERILLTLCRRTVNLRRPERARREGSTGPAHPRRGAAGAHLRRDAAAGAATECVSGFPGRRDWYFIAEQPAPAPHLSPPGGCAALRIVLVTWEDSSCS